MKTTIKQLRKMLDGGLISKSELTGFVVGVGFMSLRVVGYEETPGDYLPNKWHLSDGKNNYSFTPYNGLERE